MYFIHRNVSLGGSTKLKGHLIQNISNLAVEETNLEAEWFAQSCYQIKRGFAQLTCSKASLLTLDCGEESAVFICSAPSKKNG